MSKLANISDRRRAMLQRMAERGLERARELRRQMEAAESTEEILALVDAFEAAGRTVRRSIKELHGLDKPRRKVRRAVPCETTALDEAAWERARLSFSPERRHKLDS